MNQKILRDSGLPCSYRPPESMDRLEGTLIDGAAFDMWSFGMMCVELFCYFILCRKSPESPNDWSNDVYPILRYVLQKEAFKAEMERAFPLDNITSDQAELALNFVHGFLRMQPTERMDPCVAQRHKFLYWGTLMIPLPDPAWDTKDFTTPSF